MKKKITVVIVTFNGGHWVNKNINSLIHSNFPVDIIVVDNASSDNSVALLEAFPQIEIIKSAVNLGFGKANNIGIKKALTNGSDAVFLLNQDTWIFEDTIGNLAREMNLNPEFGILSPMHFSADAITLDENFNTYYNRKEEEQGNCVTVPFVNAAAWLVSRECFDKVGFFEPMFGHYGEDRNFCDRVKYHDFKIGIIKDSKICHDRTISRSFKKDVVQSEYKVLITLLDINNSLTASLVKGLAAVFGLPKYFFKFYGFTKSLKLLYQLSIYYFEIIFGLKKIKAIRESSKEGINGK